MKAAGEVIAGGVASAAGEAGIVPSMKAKLSTLTIVSVPSPAAPRVSVTVKMPLALVIV